MISSAVFGQKIEKTHQLSSHILDVSKGIPALAVTIKLEKFNEANKTWTFVEEKVTDKNGRVSDFLSNDQSNLGIYKLAYLTSDYIKKMKMESLSVGRSCF